MKNLDARWLRNCATGTCWDLGNKVLYDLCKKYPDHKKQDEILAKIWLIGRSYAAAIERRPKSDNVTGENFYESKVGPAIREAKIDKWLTQLLTHKRPSPENAQQILAAHKKLTKLFHEITGHEKRSLASKYLHFHFPKLFYLYDSRAAREISKISGRAKRTIPTHEYDNVYAGHFLRCLEVVERIEQEHGIYLSPRRLDDYLLRFGK